MTGRIGRASAVVVACVALGSAWVANAAVAETQTGDETDTEAAAATPSGDQSTYHFTGDAQSYTVPAGVHELLVTASGAEGGDGGGCIDPSEDNRDCGAPGDGGRGATVTTSVAVTPGETLTIFVGGEGEDGDILNLETARSTAGAASTPVWGDISAAISGPSSELGFIAGGDGGWGYGEGGDGADGFILGGSGGGGAGGSAILRGDSVLAVAAGGAGGGGGGGNADITPNGRSTGGDGGESAEDGDDGQIPCEGEGGEAGSLDAEGDGGGSPGCPPLDPADSPGVAGHDGDDGDGPDGGDGGSGNLDTFDRAPDIQGAGGGGGGGGVHGGGGGGAGGANENYAAGSAGGGGGGGDFCPAGGTVVDGDRGGNGVVSIVPVVTLEPKFTG